MKFTKMAPFRACHFSKLVLAVASIQSRLYNISLAAMGINQHDVGINSRVLIGSIWLIFPYFDSCSVKALSPPPFCLGELGSWVN